MKEFVGLDWVWRNSEKPDTKDIRWWYPATVPGSVLNDLWKSGKIADPHYELNSKLAEWVPERTWVYRKSFPTPTKIEGRKVTLCFDGIDYCSEIYLNGRMIGKQEGMFLPFSNDITDLLDESKENLLAVVIEAAPKEQPQVGRTSLVRTHKTRMNYWWDFCPRMIHQGIWDNVYLKITGQAMIKDIYLNAELAMNYEQATITAEIETSGANIGNLKLEINSKSYLVPSIPPVTRIQAVIDHPRLWQPNGYGKPHQYEITITLFDLSGNVSDEKTLKYGIRNIEFEKNERCNPQASPFVLKVNGRKIYMNGYNWVPMDAMYGVERPEKLKRLIKLAKDAQVVIFRVWGGGLIEKDSFYEVCAENGILVWQEFIQSSSGIDNKPPENTEFMEMLLAQAEIIIKRKRNHTSLAIWCGGNELSDWEGNPVDNSDPLIGRLQEVVKRLDPGRRWLPSSPSGGVFSNSLTNIIEQPDMLWDVHGPWEHQGLHKHCELYNRGTSLLHSEFGVEGMTNRNTLEKSISKEHMLPANKENEIYFHRGSWWINEPLVQEVFGGLSTIEEIRRASQYLQYEGLKYAIECNRRRAFQNSGTFPWQFNEPYPNNYCTSSLDYYANPKPAYYGVKNSYGSILISASFESPTLFDQSELSATIHITTSLTAEEIERIVSLSFCCEVVGSDGTVVRKTLEPISVPENSTSDITKVSVPTIELPTELILLRLKVIDKNGVCLAENEYLFTKRKDLRGVFDLPRPELTFTMEKDAIIIQNNGREAALFLFLTSNEPLPEQDFIYFDKNYFSLMPMEQRTVHITSDSTCIRGKRISLENFVYSKNINL
jgi:beta-mannosidase